MSEQEITDSIVRPSDENTMTTKQAAKNLRNISKAMPQWTGIVEPCATLIESLTKDKNRLDWLQKEKQDIEMVAGSFRITREAPYPNDDFRHTKIRKVIDAAMEASSKDDSLTEL